MESVPTSQPTHGEAAWGRTGLLSSFFFFFLGQLLWYFWRAFLVRHDETPGRDATFNQVVPLMSLSPLRPLDSSSRGLAASLPTHTHHAAVNNPAVWLIKYTSALLSSV